MNKEVLLHEGKRHTANVAQPFWSLAGGGEGEGKEWVPLSLAVGGEGNLVLVWSSPPPPCPPPR